MLAGQRIAVRRGIEALLSGSDMIGGEKRFNVHPLLAERDRCYEKGGGSGELSEYDFKALLL